MKSLIPSIVDENKFQSFLKKVGGHETKNPGTSNMIQLDQESAMLQLAQMDCSVNTKMLRTMMTLLSP